MFRAAFSLKRLWPPSSTLAFQRKWLSTTIVPQKTFKDSLHKLERLIQSSWQEDVQWGISKKLNSPASYESLEERDEIYKELIFMLTNARRVEDAVWLEGRMEKEKITIDPLTRARLLVARILVTEKADHLWQALRDIFKSGEFEEDDLWNLFNTFKWSKDKSYHIPATFIQSFIECQGEGYKPPPALVSTLVKMQTLRGDVRAAYDTLRNLKPSDSALDPYVSAIRALSDDPQEGSNAWFEKVMGLMQDRAVPGDVSLFNALIDRELSRDSFSRAVDFYEALREIHDTAGFISPDSFTYLSLFDAIPKLYDPAKSGGFTPRHIFRDMVVIRFGSPDNQPPSDRLLMDVDQALLNASIQAFLSYSDYPAVVVALRYFHLLGLPVDVHTYRNIIKHVATQLHLDYEFNKARCWVPRFMFSVPPAEWKYLLRPPPAKALKEFLLKMLQKPGHGVRYTVPTYDMMQEKKPLPASARLDVIPLQDCVTLALRADLHLKSQRPTIGEGHLKLLAQESVGRAEQLMLPDVPIRNWGNGPKHRTGGRH